MGFVFHYLLQIFLARAAWHYCLPLFSSGLEQTYFPEFTQTLQQEWYRTPLYPRDWFIRGFSLGREDLFFPLGKIKVRELRRPKSCFFSSNSPLVHCTETWNIAHTYRYHTGREMATAISGRTDWVHTNLSLHFEVLYGRNVDVAKGWRKEGHKGRFNMENISEHLECVIINDTSLVSVWLRVFNRFVCWSCASLNSYLHKIYNRALCWRAEGGYSRGNRGGMYSNNSGFSYFEIFFQYLLLHLFDFPWT